MALFATLIDASVQCPGCGAHCIDDWQFYFGAVTNLPRYRVGDSITWDQPAMYGLPSMREVRAVAYGPACASCPVASILAEILIEDSVIVSLANPGDRAHSTELLYEGEARVPRFHHELYRVRGELDEPGTRPV